MTRFEEDPDFNVHDLLTHPHWKTKDLVQEFAQNIINAENHNMNFAHMITGRDQEDSVTTIWNSVRDKVIKNTRDSYPGPDITDQLYWPKK